MTTSTPTHAVYEFLRTGRTSRKPVAVAQSEAEAVAIADNLNAKSLRRYIVCKLVSF